MLIDGEFTADYVVSSLSLLASLTDCPISRSHSLDSCSRQLYTHDDPYIHDDMTSNIASVSPASSNAMQCIT